MARIQKLESDSAFNLSNVLNGKILTYKTYENGRVVHKAKLSDGRVVEITPKLKGISGAAPITVQSDSQGVSIGLSVDNTTIGIYNGLLKSNITFAKLDIPDEGFAATYQLQDANGNGIGAKINIIQDIFLKDGEFIEQATAQDQASDSSVVIGQPYIKLTVYIQRDSTPAVYKSIYIPAKDLVTIYSAGKGIILNTGVFSLQQDSNSDTARYLSIESDAIGLKNIRSDINAALQEAKEYVDNKLSDSIDLSNYYTKGQVDSLLQNLSNSIDLSNYYTKPQIDSLLQELSNSVDLSDYYTKGEMDIIIKAVSDSLSSIKNTFGDYYTKLQVDELLQNLSNSIDLSNYYTKPQIDRMFQELDPAIIQKGYSILIYEAPNNKVTLSKLRIPVGLQTNTGKYYPIEKQSVILGSDSVIINLPTYLAYEGAASFIPPWRVWFLAGGGNYSDSIDLSNYYTKDEIDGLLQTKGDVYCVYINQVEQNKRIFQGIRIPVGIQTNLGNYYPIQKGSLKLNSDSTVLNLTPYLAYDGVGSFTGTWKVWFLTRNFSDSLNLNDYYTKEQIDQFFAQFSDSVDLSNYYTKSEVDQLIEAVSPVPAQGYYIQISDALDDMIHISKLRIPVGLQTNTGKYYPIEKQSVILGSDSVIIDITPYLAYSNASQFVPIWKIWFLSGITENILNIVISQIQPDNPVNGTIWIQE